MTDLPPERRSYLIAQAMTFMIEAFSRLPEMYQQKSEIDDMKKMLNDLSEGKIEAYQYEAQTRVKWLLDLGAGKLGEDELGA